MALGNLLRFFRTKRPLSPEAQFALIRQEVIKQVATVGRQHVNRRAAVVAKWKDAHRPEFEANFEIEPGRVSMTIDLKNGDKSLGKYGSTIADLWDWWNLGTTAHAILPRFATVLRFRVGKAFIFTPWVAHPGTNGTHQNERINKELAPSLQAAADIGVRNGLQRAKKG